MEPNKRMLFQSVGLVGAVGIEIASLTDKSFKRDGVAPPYSQLEPFGAKSDES